MAGQEGWRYCQNCHQMFYDGDAAKGQCVATKYVDAGLRRGGHVAQPGSYSFVLPKDVPEKLNLQGGWRCCAYCYTLFYNGFAQKGQCPSSRGHVPNGWQLALPHDLDPKLVTKTYTQQHTQKGWRFCRKCYTLFYDGYANKGACALGDGHVAWGWNFMLPHDLPNQLQFTLPVGYHNDVPIFGVKADGVANLILRQEGVYKWWGKLRGISAVEYNVSIAMLVKDSQNNPYRFLVPPSHISGILEPGQPEISWGDQMEEKPNADIRENWAFLAAGYTGDCRCSCTVDAVNLLLVIAAGLGLALTIK